MLYRGNNLKEIVFPLGGIGTGSIGLAGNGAFVDWEIFNRPNKGSLNKYTHFAVKAEKADGTTITKVLQGDWTKDLIGKYSKTYFNGYGFGPESATMCAYPHFKNVQFDGCFPIATLTFEDDNFPAKIIMEAFNPFIPLDADNSSIPAALFNIKIESYENDVTYTVVLSVHNPFETTQNTKVADADYTAVQMIHSDVEKGCKEYGDITIAVNENNAFSQEYWYRGIWQDNVTSFWRELSEGNLPDRHYSDAGKDDICSVGATKLINSDENKTYRFAISWNVPNNYNFWNPLKDDNGEDVMWKNYYATLFDSSVASCTYLLNNWDDLYTKTKLFCDSLHTCTLDPAVIDAVSSTISVLKSPTVLRLEDGTFYGWEGVHEMEGSCEGTCTHVWSYAYALCFLFPELERSLRDTEFKYDTDENGRMFFRTALPLGRGVVHQPPCVDGQMATIIKIYRDWKITGNDEWLKNNWANIKKVLEFAWNENNTYEWDWDKDGVLEGRQHHTLDMELFGPSSWLQSMYLCALKAAAKMAEYLDDIEKHDEYLSLFENGYAWTKENLFNGEYFFHKIDLENSAATSHFNCPEYWNDEKGEIKYQIGDGCEIDQMLGQWHANICGLGDIFDKEQRQTALRSMFKNNFKESLREFTNMWRVFALNDEGGAVMCDYPENKRKPIIPIPYCEECMTGFEYAFAGLLISEGMVDEGLSVVRSIRDRYDGAKRNPFNEIECGSNYARPMASFALLSIFSGFEFDMSNKHIGFSPILPGDFKCFWSLGSGWGDFVKTYTETESCAKIIIAHGSLELSSITLGRDKADTTTTTATNATTFTTATTFTPATINTAGLVKNANIVKRVVIDGKEVEFTQNEHTIHFAPTTATHEICVDFEVKYRV